jgi:hypothetical protein
MKFLKSINILAFSLNVVQLETRVIVIFTSSIKIYTREINKVEIKHSYFRNLFMHKNKTFLIDFTDICMVFGIDINSS